MKEETDFNLPLLGRSNKSVAELVLIILTEEWPLSTKGLVNRLKRLHAKEVSFQGVHKAVKKLYEDNVLWKDQNYYKLNPEWVTSVSKFYCDLEERYAENKTNLKDIP